MTVRLSRMRVANIMRLYFAGVPQRKIAEKVRADQSTVSLYSSRFKEFADSYGLNAAGEEFDVQNEVDTLRSLACELYKAKLAVEDAIEGLKVKKAFMKLGIDTEKHLDLIRVCSMVDDPGFIEAALKLSDIEGKTNISYEDMISKSERLQSEIPIQEQTLSDIQLEIKKATEALEKTKSQVEIYEKKASDLETRLLNKQGETERQLSHKMKATNVKLSEIEEVAKLKSELAEAGMDIALLIKLAKEYKK